MDCARRLMACSGLPRLETAMLLQHAWQKPRAWLIAHDTDPLPPPVLDEYRRVLELRVGGEPMAYIVGWREFMGHRLEVSRDVLIPRPETELLVETACNILGGGGSVLDLGTGSGAVAISIALACPGARVLATDISARALGIAAKNARDLSARVEFLRCSWYDSLLDRPSFDLIVANPPYVCASDSHLGQGDLRFEPRIALTDGADGLQALRAVILGAPARLNPGGSLWVEHGWDQAQAVRGLLTQAGIRHVKSMPDLSGIERVSGGSL